MGLGKWFARRGNIGGTAKWAAEGFWSALKNGIIDLDSLKSNDKISTVNALNEIVEYCLGLRNLGLDYKEIVGLEYDEIPDHVQPAFDTYLSQTTTYTSDEGKSLIKLVLSVLKVEAELHLNTIENIEMFVKVVEEELVKLKVGERFIYGTSNPVSDEDRNNALDYLIDWASEYPK